MDIKQLVNSGWARHATETEAVAAELEAHAADATENLDANALVQLGVHVIGEHLNDWPRACRLAEKAAAGRQDAHELSGMYSMLASTQYMAGKTVDALVNEAHAVRLTQIEDVSVVIAIRMRVASALVFNRRLEEGERLLDAALNLAREQDEKLACDISIAATTHNLANELLYRKQRGAAEDALMIKAAEASREFWLKCGTWENEERGEFLLALVHNDLKQPRQALAHIARGLEVIAKNGEEVVDEAFLNLAAATAWRLQDDRGQYETSMARADELAADFKEDGLKNWYKEERAKVEWR